MGTIFAGDVKCNDRGFSHYVLFPNTVGRKFRPAHVEGHHTKAGFMRIHMCRHVGISVLQYC